VPPRFPSQGRTRTERVKIGPNAIIDHAPRVARDNPLPLDIAGLLLFHSPEIAEGERLAAFTAARDSLEVVTAVVATNVGSGGAKNVRIEGPLEAQLSGEQRPPFELSSGESRVTRFTGVPWDSRLGAVVRWDDDRQINKRLSYSLGLLAAVLLAWMVIAM
jgi:hypothetical protein